MQCDFPKIFLIAVQERLLHNLATSIFSQFLWQCPFQSHSIGCSGYWLWTSVVSCLHGAEPAVRSPRATNDARKRLPMMRQMQRYCFPVPVAPIGCVTHFVTHLISPLSRLRLVASLSRQLPVEQQLSSWTKCIRLRVATKTCD